MIDKKRPPLHITQHKRFVPYGTHSNPDLVETSFMLEPLDEIVDFEIITLLYSEGIN